MARDFEKVVNNRKNLLIRRRYLRNNPTTQEALLWSRLKNSQIGAKFRRQHSIGGYIVDFYCPSRKLVVEIDGPAHSDKENTEYDKIRSEYISGLGIKVIRFSNQEINQGLDKVMQRIQEYLTPAL